MPPSSPPPLTYAQMIVRAQQRHRAQLREGGNCKDKNGPEGPFLIAALAEREGVKTRVVARFPEGRAPVRQLVPLRESQGESQRLFRPKLFFGRLTFFGRSPRIEAWGRGVAARVRSSAT